ncbi:MAG: acyl carrier protein [Acidimicrobiales bacterium]
MAGRECPTETEPNKEKHRMDRSEALAALRTAAVDVLQVDADKVVETASFAEDLEADSLDLVELVMSLEDSLDITIEEDELADVRTVGDALNVIVAASTAAA